MRLELKIDKAINDRHKVVTLTYIHSNFKAAVFVIFHPTGIE
jgi:hypothetical protein